MKATLSKNKKFIQISPKPAHFLRDGLRIYLSVAQDEYSLPVATTDINIGQCRYYLPSYLVGDIVKIDFAKYVDEKGRIILTTVDL